MSLVAKKIVITTAYVAVTTAESYSNADVTLLAAADNAGVAYVRGDDGATDVPIPKGIPFPLTGVRLSSIFLKGTLNDVVVIIGSVS
jgi:hypothetical protein